MRFDVDWREGIDFKGIRTFRHARAQAAMARAGLDAVIAFEYANGRYLAGLRPLWAPNFMVRQAVVSVRGTDDIIVFVHQDDAPHRRKVMTWVPPENIMAFPTALVSESAPTAALQPVAEALAKLGLSKGRVGVDIATVTVLRRLEEVLGDGFELVDANAAMSGARMVKSPAEVGLLEDASAVVDLAMDVAISKVRPGIRECDILADVMHVFYTHGAEVPQCNLIVCSGPNTAPMQRFAGDRVIRRGDLVFMDIGACFNGLFSEATRTVVCEDPADDLQGKIYRTVHSIHQRTIEALTVGTSAIDVQAAASEHYSNSPFVGHMQEMIIAHGIGVGYAEAPFIAPPGRDSPPLVLEEGMVLAVVPTIIVPNVRGGGGVRLEDLVVVAADGPKVLTQAPYDERLLTQA